MTLRNLSEDHKSAIRLIATCPTTGMPTSRLRFLCPLDRAARSDRKPNRSEGTTGDRFYALLIGLLVATGGTCFRQHRGCFYALLIGLLVATLPADTSSTCSTFLCPLDRAARSDRCCKDYEAYAKPRLLTSHGLGRDHSSESWRHAA